MINSSDVLILYLCLLFQISISVRITWLNIPDFTELLTSSSFPNGFSTPPFPVLPRLIIQDFIPTLRYDEWHVYFISLSCACLNRLYIVVDLRRKKNWCETRKYFAICSSLCCSLYMNQFSRLVIISCIQLKRFGFLTFQMISLDETISGLTVIWVGCF